MFGYLGSRALCNGWFGVEEPREGYSVDIILFFFSTKIRHSTTQMASKVALPPVRGAGYEPGINQN
jgi:hypothetical protein